MGRLLLTVGYSMLCIGTCLGQNPSMWKPSSLPPKALDLKNTAVAKTSANGEDLMLLVPKITEELRTRDIQVTKMTTEQRTRTVVGDDGKTVEMAYTVQVPVTETRPQSYAVDILGPVERMSVSIDTVRAWRLDGKAVAPQELGRLCSNPRHVLVVEMPTDAELGSVDPYFASLIRPDALILYIASKSIKRSDLNSNQ